MDNNTLEQLKLTTLKNTKRFNFDGNKFVGKCVKCYDGDTIHVVFFFLGKMQRFICRLDEIDCPEIKSKDPKEQEKAIIARDYLRERILNKLIFVECGKFDKYGRILVKLKYYPQNENSNYTINDEMLEKSLAIKYK